MRAFAALAVLAATALLAGGCGGSSKQPLTKAEYVKQMKVIGHSLSTSINSISNVTDAKSAATALGGVQDDLRAAAVQMGDISPPTEIKTQHEALTQAVNDFADQLDPIIQKLNNGNLAALGGLTTLKAFTDLQTAAAAIAKAGYKING
jgi:hypothetical protein